MTILRVQRNNIFVPLEKAHAYGGVRSVAVATDAHLKMSDFCEETNDRRIDSEGTE